MSRSLRDPEPDLLKHVPRVLLGPVAILGIQGSFPGGDVGVGWVVPVRTLEKLPEEVEADKNRYANVGCEEVYGGRV